VNERASLLLFFFFILSGLSLSIHSFVNHDLLIMFFAGFSVATGLFSDWCDLR